LPEHRNLTILHASLTTVEWVETYNFRLHNCPGRPTYYPRMANLRPSVLDICLSAGPATEYIDAWSIDDESGSDHSIVGLLLSFKKYDNNVKIFNLNRVFLMYTL
jgi:hypothetical protein